MYIRSYLDVFEVPCYIHKIRRLLEQILHHGVLSGNIRSLFISRECYELHTYLLAILYEFVYRHNNYMSIEIVFLKFVWYCHMLL